MRLDASLSAAMEAALIARAKDGPNSDPPVSERKVPRASVLSSGCGRKVYFWLTGAPEDPMDALTACAFQDGKDFEDGILADMRTAIGAGGFALQVRADTNWFRGSADMVTLAKDGTHEAIVDAKSANPASFDITLKKGEVSESYITQLSLYAHALGATECIVIYRQKGGTRRGNKQVYAVFRFPPDEAKIAHAKGLAIEAMAARDGNGPIPPRAFKREYWGCQYCSFQTHCWEGT